MPVSYIDELVKKPGLEYEYTSEMLEDIVKCSRDFYYFLKYVKIVHPDQGRISLLLRDYQEKFTDLILNNRWIIGLFARQSGKTTLLSAYAIWRAVFNADWLIGIGSNNASSAKDFLSRVKIIYEELPGWLKPGVTEYNVHSMSFENGTRIQSVATSKNSFRGRTLNLLVLDEFAHLISDRIANEFYTSTYPTLSESKESQLVILSTPKGGFNLFAKLYKDAEHNLNNFKHLKVTWRDVPGRDDKWKEDALKGLGNDLDKFNQEYEVEFIGSTSTVINSDILKEISTNYKNPEYKDLNNKLLIYEMPIPNCKYILGADPSRGTSGNYAAMQILKVDRENPVKLKQVAVFYDNKIDPYQFARIIYNTALYYNNAYVMIENNSEGIVVVNELWWTYEYEHMYNSGRKAAELGIRATKKTKSKAVSLMKKLIESRALEIVDKETLSELNDFSDINGKLQCNNLNDDLVSALYWACYITDLNILSDISISKIDEEPWSLILDGSNSTDTSWFDTAPSIIF